VLIQEPLGSHEHAWRAKTALYGANFNKGLLQRVEMIGGAHPLHRFNVAASDLADWSQTGPHGPAIQEHGAGATFAFVVAALLGPGQAQFLPQDVKKGSRWIDAHSNLLIVYIKIDNQTRCPSRARSSSRGCWLTMVSQRAAFVKH
jgi:hypothetical protein